MHINLLKDLYHLRILQLKVNQLMPPIKNVIFKNCAPFANCISRINNTQVDDAYDIDVIIPVYNLIEYSDNYSEIFGII